MSTFVGRTGPTPEEIAVVTAAFLAVQRRAVEEAVLEETPAWRFSGRWFTNER